MPARCQSAPNSPPPRRFATASTPPAATQVGEHRRERRQHRDVESAVAVQQGGPRTGRQIGAAQHRHRHGDPVAGSCRARRSTPASGSGDLPARLRQRRHGDRRAPAASRSERARLVKEVTPTKISVLESRELTAVTEIGAGRSGQSRWPPARSTISIRCAASDDQSSANVPAAGLAPTSTSASCWPMSSRHGAFGVVEVDGHQPPARGVPFGAQVQGVAVGSDDVVGVRQVGDHDHLGVVDPVARPLRPGPAGGHAPCCGSRCPGCWSAPANGRRRPPTARPSSPGVRPATRRARRRPGRAPSRCSMSSPAPIAAVNSSPAGSG